MLWSWVRSPLEVLFVLEGLLSGLTVCIVSTASYLTTSEAALAQLGERQTEDLKVPGSIPGGGTFFY